MNIKNIFSHRQPSKNGVGFSDLGSGLFPDGAASDIKLWREIYAGGGEWRYTRRGGMEGGMRRVASMGAAKTLCEEFAALVFGSQCDFRFSDGRIDRYVRETLQNTGFWREFPLFLEKVFAFGYGAVKAEFDKNGKISLGFFPADRFIPTEYDNSRVRAGVFLSPVICGEEKLVHVQHVRGGKIENKFFSQAGKEITSEAAPREINISNLNQPLFVYFRTATANNQGGGLGLSVFANAVDIIKSLDIALDSLQREFVLGRKRIIVPASALRGEYDENGRLRKFFDTGDEVYQAFSSDDAEELKIHDNTSALRTREHIEAIDCLLDLLCTQTGLSQGEFTYKTFGGRTATEVLQRGGKSYRAKRAHQSVIRECLIELCSLIAELGRANSDLPPDAVFDAASADVIFADATSADSTAAVDNAVKLASAGIITPEKAFSDVFGSEGKQGQALEQSPHSV